MPSTSPSVNTIITTENQASPTKEQSLSEIGVDKDPKKHNVQVTRWPAFIIFVLCCAGGIYYVRQRLLAKQTKQGGRYTRVETSQV